MVVEEVAGAVVAVIGLFPRVLVVVLVVEVDVVPAPDPAGSAVVAGAGATPAGDVERARVPVARLVFWTTPTAEAGAPSSPSTSPAETTISAAAGPPPVGSPRTTGAGGINRPRSANPIVGRRSRPR